MTARDHIENILSLSPMQEGMLFHTLAASEPGMYIQQLVLRIAGPLDVAAFEKAWAQVVARHQALRSAFVWESAEKPLQVIFRQAAVRVRHEDWRGEAEAARADRLHALVEADRTQGFDLRRPPLLRLTLVRLGERDYRFLYTYHHILLDGWSGSIVFKDMLALYTAFRRGRELQLPPPVGLERYAEWARGQTMSDPEAFFRRHLAGLRAPTPLYQDLRAQRSAPAGAGFDVREAHLSAADTARLGELARAHRLTLGTVLQGAWAALLSRHSGENDVLFGAVSSGRPAELAGMDQMVGMFINTLPARVRIEPEDRLVPWLQRLQQQMAELRQYEHVPLVKIHPWSEIPAGAPLFETCQVLENVAMDVTRPFTAADLEFTMDQYSARTSDPITLLAFPGDRFKLQLLFDRGRIAPATAERLLGHLATWLAAAPAAAQQRVVEMPLLTDGEKRQLAVDWAGPDKPLPDASVHGLFAAQARRTPDARAVEDAATAYSYDALDRRANQIAHALRALGAGPGTRVGLGLTRSADMVAAMLGVMKANAAYVPLDPAFPAARIAFMAEDAQLTALVTEEGCLERLPLPESRVLFLDRDRARIAAQPDVAPLDRARPDDVVYVLYTSGSTGKPKGVQVLQRSLLNLLRWSHAAPLVLPSDALLAVTSLSFDIAETELLAPLLIGARVIVAPQEVVADAPALRELCDRSGATVMQATPATWRMLLADAWRPDPKLRILSCGEAVSHDLGRQMCSGGNEAWNLYGPTETTIYSTAWKIDPAAPEVLIGKPLDNTQLYVVDAAGQPCPVGVTGELLIGGAGVALGYLNRPELTAERFVSLPATGGARVYRTGDLVRWRDDGSLDFLGRNDRQVKIRGNRVELGEIEAALDAQPAVRHAAVTVVEDAAGEQSLVGYVVADAAESLGQAGAALDGEHVGDWRRAWDDAYDGDAGGPAAPDPTFNTRGWNSSYDGKPIAADQMREWVETTVARIAELGPRRILEIGCGTGLLLFRLARACEAYIGADFSARALAEIAANLSHLGEDAARVRLLQAEARQLGAVADGAVDTVVLNSVAQYFPSVAAVVAVLEEATRTLAPGGRIFVGDVRDLGLCAAFWASVHLAHADPRGDSAALREQIERSLAHEKELLLHRSFFAALPGRLPRVASARLLVKRGRAPTEMTRFRYDAVLQLDAAGERDADGTADALARAVDWRASSLSLARLGELLASGSGGAADAPLAVRAIPNSRTMSAVLAARLVRQEGFRGTVEALERACAAASAGAVHPEEIWSLAAAHGLSAELIPSASGGEEHFDAVFRPAAVSRAPAAAAQVVDLAPRAPAARTREVARPWLEYGNNPLQARLGQVLAPALRGALEEKLPGYMVPSAFVFLDALPLTPNGKVDRRALPRPDRAVATRSTRHMPPRDSLELQLVRIWEDVLGVAAVGVHDDFFELGGHSILAVRLVAQVEKRLGKRLPLSSVVDARTVEALARRLRAAQPLAHDQVLVCLQSGGKRAPLFCVHPAGGNVLCYRDLARALGPDFPVYAFEAALDGDGAVRDRSVAQMASAYVRAMRQAQPKGPYRLAGWSLGGLLVAEMAEMLRREGEAVSFVGVFDTILRPRGVPPVFVFDLPRRLGFARFIEEYYHRSLDLSTEELARREGEALVAYFAERMIAAEVVPPEVDVGYVRRMFLVYQDHTHAYFAHEPSQFSTPITLFRARTPMAAELALSGMPIASPTLGWSEYCVAPPTVIDVAGDHMTILGPRHVRELAERVRLALDESDAAARATPPAPVAARQRA